MRSLIIDDNISDVHQLQEIIHEMEPALITEYTLDPVSAITYIEKYKYDLVFLDMNMPDLNGLEVFEKVSHFNTPVIIVSAYPEYAVESVHFRPFDYLLKPVSPVKLQYALSRVKEHIRKGESKHLVQFQTGKNHFIQHPADEILYIKAIGDYQKVYTQDEVLIIIGTMNNLTEKMKQYGFIRVHRSFIVNTRLITRILPKHIVLDNNKIPLGRRYHRNISEMFSRQDPA